VVKGTDRTECTDGEVALTQSLRSPRYRVQLPFVEHTMRQYVCVAMSKRLIVCGTAKLFVVTASGMSDCVWEH